MTAVAEEKMSNVSEYKRRLAERNKQGSDAANRILEAKQARGERIAPQQPSVRHQLYVRFESKNKKHAEIALLHPKRIFESKEIGKVLLIRLAQESDAIVDRYWAKHGRLPPGVTAIGALPSADQLCLPVTQQESLSELVAVRADTIESRKVEWLWIDRIPMNKLSVLTGNPDQGKSLVTLYMITQLTRGWAMYGSISAPIPASEVLIMAAEDEADDTIRPRLEAAGADLSKVHILTTIMQKNPNKAIPSTEREAQLDQDILVVENYLKANPKIRMIVIDPISSFLGRVNMNREQEVRSILTPLKALAARRHVAVISVMHMNKVTDQAAIHRTGGAVAFTGVARAVWLFMNDEEDKDKHMMLRVKNNLARANGGLVFNIDTKAVSIKGELVKQPIVKWIGETENDAAGALVLNKPGRPNEKIKGATDWLAEFLSKNGEEFVVDVESFAKRAGHTWATIRRAKEELKIHAFQRDRRWVWKIPKPAIAGEPSKNNTVSFEQPSETKSQALIEQ